MGYTHYWNQTRQFSKTDWIQVEDAWEKTIAAATNRNIPLSSDNGQSALSAHNRIAKTWKFEDERGPALSINGVGKDSHETFIITKAGPVSRPHQKGPDRGFDFTKTAGKPYDTFVTAMLIWLEHSFPKHIRVRSDGDADDWCAGLDLALHAFGTDMELNFPTSLRFAAQWKNEEICGEKYALMRRFDGAICILKSGTVLYEFTGEIAEDISDRAATISKESEHLDWQTRGNSIDRKLKLIANGAEIIGGTKPSVQILEPGLVKT